MAQEYIKRAARDICKSMERAGFESSEIRLVPVLDYAATRIADLREKILIEVGITPTLKSSKEACEIVTDMILSTVVAITSHSYARLEEKGAFE